MTSKGKLLSAVGLVIAGGAALAFGVSFSILLLIAVSLLCPAAMFFGMHGSGACNHNEERGHAEKAVAETSTKVFDSKRAA